MSDYLDKPIREFTTSLNVEMVPSIDKNICSVQYSGVDSYENLDAFLQERKAIVRNLNLDDFSNPDALQRSWLLNSIVIHAELYPTVRMAKINFFFLKEKALFLDAENIVLKCRTHLANKR